MKKMIAILPLAVMLANCSTTRNTDTGVASSTDEMSVSTSSTASTDVTNTNSGNDVTMSGSATVSPNNTWNNGSGSTTTYNSTGSTNWGWDYGGSTGVYTSSYDPNLHSDLDGEWSLAMSPDLSSSWLPDNTTSNTYTWNNGSGTTYTSGSATTGYNTDLNSSGNSGTLNSQSTTTYNNGTVDNSLNTSGVATKTKTKTTGDKTKTKTKTTNGTTTSTDVNSSDMSTSSGTDMSSSSSTTTTTYNSGSATTGGWSNQTLLSSNGNSYMVPKLNLFIGNGSYSGFTGCNAISGRINTVGNAISFENTMPSTAIDCAGGFSQQAFLDRLSRVDSYELNNGQLLLKQGSTVLLTLNRNGNSSMTTSSNQ
ncbi:MAG: hypothetical protein JWN76_3095 [Chitinophagaceae bacterium]|nr:hypothetical protein [Chitinophagaceae bacterium]